MRILTLLTFILFSQVLISQTRHNSDGDYDSFYDWKLGINFGFYFPNGYNAGFYNGNPNNENSINYVFNNKYWRDDISLLLNSSDTFYVEGLPQKMKYNTSFNMGFYAEKHINKSLGFFAQFNYSKLKTSDAFTINVDPNNVAQFEDIRLYSIYGVETRNNIDIGIFKFLGNSDQYKPYFELGLNLNNTKVVENKIEIEGKQYNLINVYLNQIYVPNTQLTEYEIRQGGIGYGGLTGVGMKILLNDSFIFAGGGNIYIQKINLTGYNNFSFNYNLYLRLIFSLDFQFAESM